MRELVIEVEYSAIPEPEVSVEIKTHVLSLVTKAMGGDSPKDFLYRGVSKPEGPFPSESSYSNFSVMLSEDHLYKLLEASKALDVQYVPCLEARVVSIDGILFTEETRTRKILRNKDSLSDLSQPREGTVMTTVISTLHLRWHTELPM